MSRVNLMILLCILFVVLRLVSRAQANGPSPVSESAQVSDTGKTVPKYKIAPGNVLSPDGPALPSPKYAHADRVILKPSSDTLADSKPRYKIANDRALQTGWLEIG